MSGYILGIDQSTQGTKALLFDEYGALAARSDLPHRQIVNDLGWVEHDPEEIYRNVIQSIKNVVEKAGIDKESIHALGISNQRETSLAWDPEGNCICNAIVWQCARAKELCENLSIHSESIRTATGLPLSPYFPAGKLAWILENVPGAAKKARDGRLRMGTMDTYLVYRLTHGRNFRTDFSNASRTQLFNIHDLCWDRQICQLFGIPAGVLARVTDSNGFFGTTDLEGYLKKEIPIHAVLGDSHGALFGHGCFSPGMVKSTYGTGSSVMMNIGSKSVISKHGLATSVAWGMDGEIRYVLEGNINYTGAVISWLKDDVGLISSAPETQALAEQANPRDRTYLVPAFTGLGAPYWDSQAQGICTGSPEPPGKGKLSGLLWIALPTRSRIF